MRTGTIEDIRGIHAEKDIAVVGSSPTVSLFKGIEDVSIAVNGAAHLFPSTDYFMCMDGRSPRRDWFYASGGARIVVSFVAPFDKIIYPDEGVRQRLQKNLADHFGLSYQGEDMLIDGIEKDFGKGYNFLPNVAPTNPHVLFNVESDFNLINRDQTKFVRGASVSGAALQAAFLMGARRIHLYGCSFDNNNGSNYCYTPRNGEDGTTQPYHADGMNTLISRVQRFGVDVYVHGPSNLTEGTRVE